MDEMRAIAPSSEESSALGIGFTKPGDLAGIYAARRPDIDPEGFLDIVGHGNSDGFEVGVSPPVEKSTGVPGENYRAAPVE